MMAELLVEERQNREASDKRAQEATQETATLRAEVSELRVSIASYQSMVAELRNRDDSHKVMMAEMAGMKKSLSVLEGMPAQFSSDKQELLAEMSNNTRQLEQSFLKRPVLRLPDKTPKPINKIPTFKFEPVYDEWDGRIKSVTARVEN